ncbi:hypothetical protein GGR39_002090 [Novosphingobium fluoreni]|uniref:DUF2946 domain-containing protein n=1 Tax=Novosphingobium fluoreni TaxID=1391222 RepID=A0A7W6BYW2_9SPHN|nr:DUF2946 family protein [Novosphingobium fluoreni]MBB3940433.1 hypothetical protein [Novosphingobium fluoreni]
MHRLRDLVLANRPFAGAILVLALMMKVVIPAGFMPTVSNDQIVASICSGTGRMTMAMPIPGLQHGKSDGSGHQDKAGQPCIFAGLSAPAFTGADPLLLAITILFILVLGLRPMALPNSTAPPYLRPPLRGPPLY